MAELDRPEGAWVGLDLHLGWLTTTTFSTRSSTLRPLTGPALGAAIQELDTMTFLGDLQWQRTRPMMPLVTSWEDSTLQDQGHNQVKTPLLMIYWEDLVPPSHHNQLLTLRPVLWMIYFLEDMVVLELHRRLVL